jgi:RimJ/RimL family protein N-acetyltransferase
MEPTVTARPSAAIRLLTPDDATLYRDIRLQALRQDPNAFTSTFEGESQMPVAWFAERIAKGHIFGAFIDGALSGVAGCWPMEAPKIAHKAALWGMYVGSSARGVGLGERLVAAIIAHATGRFEQLMLSVVAGNEPAYRLYRKMGFSEYGHEMKALKVDGSYFDEILMVRFLASD